MNIGWVPIYTLNLAGDVPGYVQAPATRSPTHGSTTSAVTSAGSAPAKNVMLHQQYVGDIVEQARGALATVDPTPYFMKYGQNAWAGVRAYLDAVTDIAAAPVIEKYTGVLGAADVFTTSTTLWVLESIRLDDGVGIPVHA